MLMTHLKIILRYLKKHKTVSLINVLCLAAGLVASAYILQYALYELSYDKYLKDNDLVYRIQQSTYTQGKLTSETVAGCGSISEVLMNNFPEIQSCIRLSKRPVVTFNYAENSFKEYGVYFSTSNFFDVFPYKIILGNNENILKEPYHIVLTRKMAKKYFGEENPIGKTIKENFNNNLIVDAVCETPPQNTHLNFDFLISWKTWNREGWGKEEINEDNSWGEGRFYTYIKLKPNGNSSNLEMKIASLVDKKYKSAMKAENEKLVFKLQPLDKIHLYSNYSFEMEKNGNAKTVYFSIVLAVLILFIAWLNYANLSTARFIERAKEIGLKKIFGGNKNSFGFQFALETFIINLIAIGIACLVIIIAHPYASLIMHRSTNFSSLFLHINGYILLLGYLICITFLGYVMGQIFYSFQTIKVLKGNTKEDIKKIKLRKPMFVFQFTVSIVLIACTLLVFKQINFMLNHKKNFESKNVLILPGPMKTDSLYAQKINAFETEIKRNLPVESISPSAYVPTQEPDWRAEVKFTDSDDNTSVIMDILPVGYDFLNVYKLQLVRGRFFSRDFGNDGNCILLSETGVKFLGFNNSESIIDKHVTFLGNDFTIIGIFKDYNHQGFAKRNEPLIISLLPNFNKFLSLKITGNYNSQELINGTKQIWQQFFPLIPFEYFFLDDTYRQQYNGEVQFGNIALLFSILAILIACFGLLGQTISSTERRIKEIGIRKVNGAKVSEILTILNKDFIKWVAIAFTIATPVAYFAMQKWLESFAYKTNLSWWIFALAGLLALGIALLTVSWQSWRAATRNPVEALRYE